jgi:hypothetical protein
MEPLIATLTPYISQYFILAFVWIVAAILALSHRRPYPVVLDLVRAKHSHAHKRADNLVAIAGGLHG